MSHAYLADARFWQFLTDLDRDLAAEVRAGGCPHCGEGVLHAARYPRKPRGVERRVLGEAYGRRESLCCAREGCRRRCTPGSVRFLGRRVYLGALVVLVAALAQPLPARGRARVAGRFGVSERTLRRWQRWWGEVFPHTELWREAQGRWVPGIATAALPASLCARFGGAEAGAGLARVLEFLRPLSIGAVQVG